MASEGSDPRDKGVFDALLPELLDLSDEELEEEIREYMEGPEPELTPEDETMLEKMGRELPGMMKGWKAAEEGTLLVKREKRHGGRRTREQGSR